MRQRRPAPPTRPNPTIFSVLFSRFKVNLPYGTYADVRAVVPSIDRRSRSGLPRGSAGRIVLIFGGHLFHVVDNERTHHCSRDSSFKPVDCPAPPADRLIKHRPMGIVKSGEGRIPAPRGTTKDDSTSQRLCRFPRGLGHSRTRSWF